MKRLFIMFSILAFYSGFSLSAFANAADFNTRCAKEKADDDFVYLSDFHFDMPYTEMQNRYQQIYNGTKRLKNHVWYDQVTKEYKIPSNENSSQTIVLQPRFLESVKKHIETALRLKYVEFVFFPDMGHSHIYIPNNDWDKMKLQNGNLDFEKILANPDIKILYHTAEQLQMTVHTDDAPHFALIMEPQLLWRYFTRNIIGDNQATGNLEVRSVPNVNTTFNSYNESIPGYHDYIVGYNLSANQNGCLEYQFQDQTYYYDISLYDLPCNTKTDTECQM